MEPGQVDNIKQNMLEALEYYKGIVSTACNSIGLARSTYYMWLDTDKEFASKVSDIQDVAIDFVEGKLFEKINGVTMLGKGGGDEEDPTYTLPPSDTAIIFYLKTKGRKRGYVEKLETTNVTYNAEVTPEEAKKISDALEEKF